ncbi:energy transducer TonB [bacterium]|nr:energy transducer TonB [bacterium]MCP5461820.1 energy transducer TonB [bacterium]
MSRIFLICLFFSLIWHSFAFTLFKLTEPYTRSSVNTEFIKVSLMPLSKNIQKRIVALNADQKEIEDYRLSLPYKSVLVPSLVPLPYSIIEAEDIAEMHPDFSSALIEHLPVIPASSGENTVHEPVNSFDYVKVLPSLLKVQQSHSFKTPPPQQNEHLQYTLSELDDSRQPLVTVFPENFVHSRPVYLRFSIDISGKVRFVLLEKSSGNPMVDQQYINALKRWAFSPMKRPHDTQQNWGRIIFF